MNSETETPADRYFVPPSPFDEALGKVPGLTWLPWVGANYANLPAGRKVLVVGESHYTNERDSSKTSLSIKETEADRHWTRTFAKESLVLDEWRPRTVGNLHRLFSEPDDRATFWGDLSYYNHVQRCMRYVEGELDRPIWTDFRHGWRVFLDVVDVLQPDHVLCIGVESHWQFDSMMTELQRPFSPVQKVEKVGNTWARFASVSVSDCELPIYFIKHCGKHFPTERWSEYLRRTAGGLMPSIAASAGHNS